MVPPTSRRRRKQNDAELLIQKPPKQEVVARTKPVKASPKPKKISPEQSPILAQINNRINDFLDMMASTRKPVNMGDLVLAAIEKRAGTPIPADGDFSRFCSPRGIRETMTLIAILDEAARTDNPKLLEKWGVG